MKVEEYEKMILQLNETAIEYYRQGDLNKARECFETILNNNIYDKDTYYNLARVYYDLGENNKCIEVLSQLLDLDDIEDDTFELLGDAYYGIRSYSESLLCYKRISNNSIVNAKIENINKIFNETQDKVYLQYMNYPYPDVWSKVGIPQEISSLKGLSGKKRRVNAYAKQFTDINFIQFKYWDKYKKLQDIRVFNAGCGTGEGIIRSALLYPEIEFIAIDISEQSLKIAKSHAKELGVKNISFIQKDILKLTNGEFGYFDIIISTGVLHHLYNPLQGIVNLKNMLNEDGVLVGMVYSTTGRQEIYEFRNAFRNVFSEVEQMGYKLDATKKFIELLQPWQRLERIKLMPDLNFGDQGIVDLLLNENETSYTSDELIGLFESVDMSIDFYDTNYLNPLNPLYNLNTCKGFYDRLRLLDKKSQIKVAEIINGSIFKFNFIAYKSTFEKKSNIIFNEKWLDAHPVLWIGAKLLNEKGTYSIDLTSIIGNDEISRFGYIDEYVKNNNRYVLDKDSFEFLTRCDGKATIRSIVMDIKESIEINEIKKLIYNLNKMQVLFFKSEKQDEYNG